MSDPPPSEKPTEELAELLSAFGLPREKPPRPIVRGPPGTLLTLPFPDDTEAVSWRGLLLAPGGIRRIGPAPAHARYSAAHGLAGPAAEAADLLAEAAHLYVQRAEELELRLAELQAQGDSVPLREVGRAERSAARLRGQIGRAVSVLEEAGRRPEKDWSGLAAALPALGRELERGREILVATQQGLTDLILLRNAEQSNRLAATANSLAATSNRIAELQNISNIRMLGITYLALILALIGAVVLIPNTGGTILGMPSAAWVPGPWVDVILIALALVPLYLVFRQQWVRQLLRGMRGYESRTVEGIGDLPERVGPARAVDPPNPPGPA